MYLFYLYYQVLNGAKLIVAEDLITNLESKFGLVDGEKFTIVGSEVNLTGADFIGTVYEHPLYKRQSSIVEGGDYITTESGK